MPKLTPCHDISNSVIIHFTFQKTQRINWNFSQTLGPDPVHHSSQPTVRVVQQSFHLLSAALFSLPLSRFDKEHRASFQKLLHHKFADNISVLPDKPAEDDFQSLVPKCAEGNSTRPDDGPAQGIDAHFQRVDQGTDFSLESIRSAFRNAVWLERGFRFHFPHWNQLPADGRRSSCILPGYLHVVCEERCKESRQTIGDEVILIVWR